MGMLVTGDSRFIGVNYTVKYYMERNNYVPEQFSIN